MIVFWPYHYEIKLKDHAKFNDARFVHLGGALMKTTDCIQDSVRKYKKSVFTVKISIVQYLISLSH